MGAVGRRKDAGSGDRSASGGSGLLALVRLLALLAVAGSSFPGAARAELERDKEQRFFHPSAEVLESVPRLTALLNEIAEEISLSSGEPSRGIPFAGEYEKDRRRMSRQYDELKARRDELVKRQAAKAPAANGARSGGAGSAATQANRLGGQVRSIPGAQVVCSPTQVQAWVLELGHGCPREFFEDVLALAQERQAESSGSGDSFDHCMKQDLSTVFDLKRDPVAQVLEETEASRSTRLRHVKPGLVADCLPGARDEANQKDPAWVRRSVGLTGVYLYAKERLQADLLPTIEAQAAIRASAPQGCQDGLKTELGADGVCGTAALKSSLAWCDKLRSCPADRPDLRKAAADDVERALPMAIRAAHHQLELRRIKDLMNPDPNASPSQGRWGYLFTETELREFYPDAYARLATFAGRTPEEKLLNLSRSLTDELYSWAQEKKRTDPGFEKSIDESLALADERMAAIRANHPTTLGPTYDALIQSWLTPALFPTSFADAARALREARAGQGVATPWELGSPQAGAAAAPAIRDLARRTMCEDYRKRSEALAQKARGIRRALFCIEGLDTGCDLQRDVLDVVGQAPDWYLTTGGKSGKQISAEIAADPEAGRREGRLGVAIEGWGKCLLNHGQQTRAGNDALGDFVVGTAITVGTAGLGAAAEGLSASARALAAAEATEAGAGGARLAQATLRARLALGIETGVAAFNAANDFASVRAAYADCQARGKQVALARPFEDGGAVPDQVACPSRPGGEGASREIRSCLDEAILGGIPGALNLGSSVARLGRLLGEARGIAGRSNLALLAGEAEAVPPPVKGSGRLLGELMADGPEALETRLGRALEASSPEVKALPEQARARLARDAERRYREILEETVYPGKPPATEQFAEELKAAVARCKGVARRDLASPEGLLARLERELALLREAGAEGSRTEITNEQLMVALKAAGAANGVVFSVLVYKGVRYYRFVDPKTKHELVTLAGEFDRELREQIPQKVKKVWTIASFADYDTSIKTAALAAHQARARGKPGSQYVTAGSKQEFLDQLKAAAASGADRVDITLHGSPSSITFANGETLTAKELAALKRTHGISFAPGTQVRFRACLLGAGNAADGIREGEFLHQFARQFMPEGGSVGASNRLFVELDPLRERLTRLPGGGRAWPKPYYEELDRASKLFKTDPGRPLTTSVTISPFEACVGAALRRL